ncbi:MAG: hypothetical protein ACXVXJ_05175 [Mycobacteriaceae bacterium]
MCGNKPVRADHLDQVVGDHITGLLADPALIRAEIGKRLRAARTADPVTRQRKQLQNELARAASSIAAMIEAYSEQLLTIDELRARMPYLCARETNLRGQIDALLGACCCLLGAARRPHWQQARASKIAAAAQHAMTGHATRRSERAPRRSCARRICSAPAPMSASAWRPLPH